MASGLLTDLYELNMVASYLRRGMTDTATFSLFVRKLPPDRGFLITAGLDDCLTFLEGFHFTGPELDYLETLGPYGRDLLRFLEGMHFTGDVWAVPEGTVLFADEPILEVSAPIAEAQIVETMLLNRVTFQTAVATKAARCVLAAGRSRLVDFAFRRSQGVDAAMSVARASAIAGFFATSNVEAARRYGLRPVGTMAHSYVQAFGDDEAAFAAFAADLPGVNTFLVDTYDTLDGVRAAIAVARRMRLPGRIAVRLDSGDLADLAWQSRRMLDEAGLHDAEIFASGGLDEHAIAELVRQGAPIDLYAVGTKVGVSADAPSLNSAYKLVDYGGQPVMKLSAGKINSPGAKQVFRGETRDVIGLRDEPVPPGHRPLLVPVMTAGRRITAPESITAMRDRCADGLAHLPASARVLRDPQPVKARHSERLALLTRRTREEIQVKMTAR
ncbi:nicotinate phosphoribosyltransferase [Sphaerimonospora sp. CA-214678]|uniref:nicotinate phosphoribosyltransferase n=1 Tax=Sphaerimonospora sp. CA-214678 TaxID=3240029 RepID=UPI003D92F8AF